MNDLNHDIREVQDALEHLRFQESTPLTDQIAAQEARLAKLQKEQKAQERAEAKRIADEKKVEQARQAEIKATAEKGIQLATVAEKKLLAARNALFDFYAHAAANHVSGTAPVYLVQETIKSYFFPWETNRLANMPKEKLPEPRSRLIRGKR